MRDAQRLALAGKSQREIADILNTTQPRVGRILRGARALREAETPEEIILRAAVDDTPRDVLVTQLSSYPYTFTEFAPFPHDGSVPGTWTQVSAAHLLELLSDEEYESVCEASPNRGSMTSGSLSTVRTIRGSSQRSTPNGLTEGVVLLDDRPPRGQHRSGRTGLTPAH
jgi:transcriptional regulator with XRE-family HTH domain